MLVPQIPTKRPENHPSLGRRESIFHVRSLPSNHCCPAVDRFPTHERKGGFRRDRVILAQERRKPGCCTAALNYCCTGVLHTLCVRNVLALGGGIARTARERAGRWEDVPSGRRHRATKAATRTTERDIVASTPWVSGHVGRSRRDKTRYV